MIHSLLRFLKPSLLPLVLSIALIALTGAADARKNTFDLPADAAEKSLKRFSEQAGLEVFYPSSVAKGIRTQPVKGHMSAREALDSMLAGTGLSVVQDEKTGAFTVKKKETPPPANAGGAKTGAKVIDRFITTVIARGICCSRVSASQPAYLGRTWSSKAALKRAADDPSRLPVV